MIKKIITLFVLCTITAVLFAQQIPDAPQPPRLVNDLANVLQTSEVSSLERSLVQFYNKTSNQITVVTVNSFDGTSVEDFAFKLGQKWGVGHKGRNNGLLILVKPKTATERGQAFIATGYGLEGAVPDAVTRRIVDNEMIPHFKNNDYAGGIAAACVTLMKLTEGEFTAEGYLKNGGADEKPPLAALLIFIPIAIFLTVSMSSKKRMHSTLGGSSANTLSNIALMSMLFGSHQHRGGGWNDFSSGGGSFGGFGGGSFGGGGSGGSW